MSATHFWIAKADCGCVVAFCSEEHFGRELKGWLKDKLQIFQVPLADAEKYPLGHTCRKESPLPTPRRMSEGGHHA